MPTTIVTAPSFATLQRHLTRDLEGLPREDISPKWIVTPTQASAARLRQQLAVGLAPNRVLAGTRVVPLTAFLGRLVEALAPPLAPAWSALFDLLLRELVRGIPPSWRLGQLAPIPGAYRTVASTLQDLADAGYGEDDIDLLAELARDTELSDSAREVLALYLTWLGKLQEHGLDWRPLQLQRLVHLLEEAEPGFLAQALAAEQGQQPEVRIHGFYDFTDVNLGVLAALSRHVTTWLYLPVVRSHPAFTFSEDLLDECRIRFRPERLLEAGGHSPQEVFFLDTFPEGSPGPRPDWLSENRASGPQAEALSAAMAVRRVLDEDPSVAPWQILVVAPDLGGIALALQEAFDAFRIPLAMPDRSPTAPASAPLRTLLELAREGASRERILQYLRDFPEVGHGFELDLDGFEVKLRAVPLYGADDWIVLRESPGDFGEWSEEELVFLDRVIRAWVSPPEQGLRARLAEVAAWLPQSARHLALESLQAEADRILGGDESVDLETWLDIAIRAAEDGGDASASNLDAVRAYDIMRARGMTSAMTVILGLGVGRFPFRIPEDPLLADTDRSRIRGLSRAVGHRLAEKQGARGEMVLLFSLLNSSTERIHWVVPESDESGKAIAPTSWVQRYLHSWQAAPSLRLPRSPAGQAAALLTVAPNDGGFLPPDWGTLLGIPPTGAGGRSHAPGTPSPHPGVMPEEALGRGYRGRRISASMLQDLAKCPFRFWAIHLAGLTALEFVPEWTDNEASLAGTLAHQVLEDLLAQATNTGITVSAALDGWEDRWDLLALRVNRHPDLRFLPPPMRNRWVGQARMLVRAYLQALQEGEVGDGNPVSREHYGTWTIEQPVQITFSGRIDRLDRRGGTLHIVDYKTGHNPFSGSPSKFEKARRLVRLGFLIQPYLYPRISREFGQAEGFSFLYLSADQAAEVSFTRNDPCLPELTPLLDPAIRGCFVPLPSGEWQAGWVAGNGVTTSHCQYCELTALCRRFDPGSAAHFRETLLTCAPQRWGDLVRILQGEEAAS